MDYFKEIVLDSFLEYATSVIKALPNIFFGFLLILLGWLISKLISFAVKKFFMMIRLDSLIEKLSFNQLLNSARISSPPSTILSRIIFYILFFFFLIPSFNIMGMDLVSDALTNFIFWIPNLIVAIAIFILGYTISDLIRNIIKTASASFGTDAGRLMGNIVFYFLIIIISITAINQAGIDTSIINSNITLAIGGIILAFAIAYGFASRDLLASIISSFYNRKKYKIGQEIRIGELQGTIEEIDSVSVILKNGQAKFVVPLSKMLKENVQIVG